ncbi:MAG: MotA/TolQ/ExbB proton channel family protein [Verrucomicrobiae bacterium]|nr:MotA/TolQ/ExbB proton channel family protein [Verrucomicrobiae bacterium]
MSQPLLAAGSMGGLMFAVEHANFAGKVILVILFIASILSWSIFLTKAMLVNRARRQTEQFLRRFRAERKPLKMYEDRYSLEGCPISVVYEAGCRELTYFLLGSDERDETFKSRLATAERITPTEMNAVRVAMERAVGEQELMMESQMIILATAVSGGPFIGLLGTVWGVMDAFTGVALAGSATLSALAPGVAGALATTALALAVAIPAMFAYNYLVTSIRALTLGMDIFSAELAASMERHYVDHTSDRTVR